METLTSIDYARLIQYVAQRFHRQMLNKTQINKILFTVYGRYLALKGKPLFTDDTPKAWPYGPVFPIVNKRINIDEVVNFPQDKINLFVQNRDAQLIVVKTVKQMYDKSAQSLTDWSHQYGSPWHRTVYSSDGGHAKWNTPIPLDYIKEYFSQY